MRTVRFAILAISVAGFAAPAGAADTGQSRYAGEQSRPIKALSADDIAALRKSIADAVAAVGPFNVLVNNAANDMRHNWREVEPDYWDDRMAINLRPMFFTIQAIAPMKPHL